MSDSKSSLTQRCKGAKIRRAFLFASLRDVFRVAARHDCHHGHAPRATLAEHKLIALH